MDPDFDQRVITTVGIDIGTATTQVMISRLTFVPVDGRLDVADRALLFASDVHLTPYQSEDGLDARALRKIVDSAFQSSAVRWSDIETGVLIMTGTALLTKNAAAIADATASLGDRLLSIGAGDAMEARLAAYGSRSVHLATGDMTVLSLDVGGATTKFAVCRDGKVISTAALNIGSRSLTLDGDQRVLSANRAIQLIATDEGVDIGLGTQLTSGDLAALAGHQAAVIGRALCGDWDCRAVARHARGGAPALIASSDLVNVSGGVAAYLAGGEQRSFGDLGCHLAAALRAMLDAHDVPVRIAASPQQATVIGAAQYSAQLAGSTIFESRAGMLPLSNVPVLSPKLFDVRTGRNVEHAHATPSDLAEAIGSALRERRTEVQSAVAIAIEWGNELVRFDTLNRLASGLAEGLKHLPPTVTGVVVVVDADIAQLLGAALVEDHGYLGDIVILDGLQCGTLDYIDVSAVPGAIAVSVKSLLLNSLTDPQPTPMARGGA